MKSMTYGSSDFDAGNKEVPVTRFDTIVVEDQATFAQIGVGEDLCQFLHQTEIAVEGVYTSLGVDRVFAHFFSIMYYLARFTYQ